MILTKLHIPLINEKIVHRTGLFEKINQGMNRKVILVSAPAGYGKTTLISDWIRQNNISTAWCSIDTRDNDPNEFLEMIIMSIQNKYNNIGKSSLELLKSPGRASIEYIIELFINDLLTLKNEIVLVLDDLHLINNKQIIDILSSLIEYKSKYLKIIISTRSDPPLAFARLRSRSEILEIRSTDLSFSKDDISIIFNKKLKLGLIEKDLILLEQKTEGWIAGLQLTALTIPGHKDISEYIAKIAGDNRYIMDYLFEEVLNTQNEEMSQFLLFSSVLERLSGSLCDAVLKIDNSQLLLESLEKSNMFLVPLDDERKWYRYHHLFGDLLKHTLAVKNKNKIPELHHNASIWFEENKIPKTAIEHSLNGGNPKRAIQLLETIIGDVFNNLEYTRIFKLLSLFNENEIIKSNDLCVIYAWILVLTGNLKGAEFYLKKLQNQISVDNLEDNEIRGKMYLTYSSLFISTGNTKAAFEYSELALKYLPGKNNSWNIWAYIMNGEAHLLRFELNKCIEVYKSALNIGNKINNSYLLLAAVSKTAFILMLQGRYQNSYNICMELLETYTSNPDIDKNKLDVTTSILYSIIGYIQIEWNLLKEGLQNVAKGYKTSQMSLNITFKGFCAIIYADTCFKLGKPDEALSIFSNPELSLGKEVSLGLAAEIYSLKNKLLIDKGEFEKLDLREKYILEDDRNNTFEYYFCNIGIARQLFVGHSYYDALNLLNELTNSLENDKGIILLIETELLKAKVYLELNEKNNAIKSISNAILYAQSEGLIRTFIVEGKEIDKLLKEVKQEKNISSSKVLGSISDNFLNKLLEAFKKENRLRKYNTEKVLSNRELDTLKLISEDLSNQNIADEMFISITTVKTHVRKILLKLDAKNRKEAVAIAKEKGIIPS